MRKTSRLYKIFAGIISIVVILSVSYFFAKNKHDEKTVTTKANKKVVEKMTNSKAQTMAEYVDVIYYINLDHRKDRKDQFLAEMKKMNISTEKIVRISAVYNKDRGHLGCSLSHINTLTEFLKTNFNNCIVFEDDFEFTESVDNVNNAFKKLADNNVDFDVCMLSGNVYKTVPIDEYPFLKKANMVLTTSGYMLSKKFATKLLENFKEGAKLLENSYEERKDVKKNDPKEYNYSGQYAIDQYWVSLQKPNKWYIFEPKLGTQRDSFSDIMDGNVHYTV